MSSGFKDISPKGDESIMLKITDKGDDSGCPGELSSCWVQYKITKGKRNYLVGSSCAEPEFSGYEWMGGNYASNEKGVLVPLYSTYIAASSELVMAENAAAEPTCFIVGEPGVPECIDFVVRRLGAGGTATMCLAKGALPGGRAKGKVKVEVKLVRWKEPCRIAPSGLKGILEELDMAGVFLSNSEDCFGKFEAVKKLHPENISESEQAQDLQMYASCAGRRFQRAKEWLEGQKVKDDEGAEAKLQVIATIKAKTLAGLAKAILFSQAVTDASATKAFLKNIKRKDLLLRADPQKAMLKEAKSLATTAHELDPTDANTLAILGFACLCLNELGQAKDAVTKALSIDSQSKAARSMLARITVKTKSDEALEHQKALESTKIKLDEFVKKNDVPQIKSTIQTLDGMAADGKLSFASCVRFKVGKSVKGVCTNPPKKDTDTSKMAEALLGKLYAVVDKKCRQIE